MQPQVFILMFTLIGGVSCALAIARVGRASLLFAGGASCALVALGTVSGNPAGAVACSVVGAGALGCALLAGPWAEASPLGPLYVMASMGFYLRGTTTMESAGGLLLVIGAALVLGQVVARELEGDAAQVGATALALGALALGLASESGYVRFLSWDFDASLLACPLLAASLAGAFSTRGGERYDVAIALCVGISLVATTGSMGELCTVLSVAVVLFVANAPSRARELAIACGVVAAAALFLLGPGHARLLSWLRMPEDIYGSGFDLHVLSGILSEAPLFGTGVVSPSAQLTSDFSTTYVLGQAVSAFGLAGLALPLACVASVTFMGLRALPCLAPAERNLALALLGCFAALSLENVAYIFHLLPVPSTPFPLLSNGTSSMLACSLLGVTLSRTVGRGLVAEKRQRTRASSTC